MQVGCYTLDLYCENSWCGNGRDDHFGHTHNEFPHVYSHELGSACRREARKDGWHLGRNGGRDFCPKCVKAGKHRG